MRLLSVAICAATLLITLNCGRAPTTGPPAGGAGGPPHEAAASPQPTAATSRASTAPALTGPTTRKTLKERQNEAVARKKAEAYVKLFEELQRGSWDDEVPDPRLIGALEAGYDRSADITQFRDFLTREHPHITWTVGIGNDVVHKPAHAKAVPSVGCLYLRLTGSGHLVAVSFDSNTGKLKEFAVTYPAPVRLRPLPLHRGGGAARP